MVKFRRVVPEIMHADRQMQIQLFMVSVKQQFAVCSSNCHILYVGITRGQHGLTQPVYISALLYPSSDILNLDYPIWHPPDFIHALALNWLSKLVAI